MNLYGEELYGLNNRTTDSLDISQGVIALCAPKTSEVIDKNYHDYKCLNKSICNILSSSRQINDVDINETLKQLKTAINGCQSLTIESQNKQRYSWTELKNNHVLRKSKDFFDFLRNLPEEGLQLFCNSREDLKSLFLTLVGARPSCIINSDMIGYLKESNHRILSDITCLHQLGDTSFAVNNQQLGFVFNKQYVLDTIKKNQAFFPIIETEKDFMEYLVYNPINVISDCERQNMLGEHYYRRNVSTGILLGIPLPEVIKFAAYDRFLYQYYIKTKFITLSIKNMKKLFGNELKQNELLARRKRAYLRAKNKKISSDTSGRIYTIGAVPEESIEILAHTRNVILPGIMYVSFDNEPINVYYKEFINKIFDATGFTDNIIKIESNKTRPAK